MSRKCDITGTGRLAGHRVSHSNIKTNHFQQPNVRKKRIFVPELNSYITVKVSTKGLKTIDKKGAFRALKDAGII